MSHINGPTNLEECLKLYETYRSYIRHEDNLINFRTNWFIAVQGILFAIYGFTLQKRLEIAVGLARSSNQSGIAKSPDLEGLLSDSLDKASYIISWTPVIGILLSGVTILALYGAHKAIRGVLDASLSHISSFNSYNLPTITNGNSTKLASFGTGASFLMPLFVIGFWVFARVYIQIKLS